MRAKYPEVFANAPKGQLPVEIQYPDGRVEPAVMNGYYEFPDRPAVPSVGRKTEGGWSHGGPNGGKIITGVPSPAEWGKPEAAPVSPAAPEKSFLSEAEQAAAVSEAFAEDAAARREAAEEGAAQVSPAAPVSPPAEKAAPAAPAAPADPISTLASAPAVKVTLPKEARVLPGKGTPAIRGTDAKGRTADQPASVFAKGNPFQGAGITKIEAGYIDRATKKFVPVKGDVGVEIPKPRVAKAQKPKAKPAAVPVPPEAAAVKVETEIAKQEPLSATAAKKTLVSELDKEIAKAPTEAELTPEQQAALQSVRDIPSRSYAKGEMISSPEQMDAILKAMASGLQQVSIDIPGDGTFSTWGVKEILQKVRDAAARLKTVPSEAEERVKIVGERPGETAKKRQLRIREEDRQDALTVYGDAGRAYVTLAGQLARAAELELPPQQVARLRRLVNYFEAHATADEIKAAEAARAAAAAPPAAPAAPDVTRQGPGAATVGDVPATPPQARAAAARVEQAAPENRPSGLLSPIVPAFHRAFTALSDFAKGVAGESLPKTTRMNQAAGEAGVRYGSSRLAARPLATTFTASVMEGTGVNAREFGAALAEDNLRSIRESLRQEATTKLANGDPAGYAEATAAADQVGTLIGSERSPFRTEDEYQDYLARPEVKQAIDKHVELWQDIVDPMYREAASIDPDTPLPTRGLQTGARVNLKAVLEGEEAAAPIRAGAGAPSLTGTFRRRSPFARRAKGTGATYEVDYGEIIRNTFERQLEIANKNAFDKQLVKAGLAEIHRPGWRGEINGEAAVGFPTRRGLPKSENIYLPRSLATEYRIVSNVDARSSLPFVTKSMNVLNKSAIAGLTDFTIHTSNLLTALFNRPVSGSLWRDTLLSLTGRADVPVTLVRVITKAFRDNEAQMAELAKIGAAREVSHGVGSGRLLKYFDKMTRLTLDDTYQQLAREGLVEASETARREYVNQVGQYNRRLQGRVTRWLRDTGFGPFVTAGKTFNAMGIRMATLSPGVKASSRLAAAALRMNGLSKWIGAAALIGTLNYLTTRKVAGRPGVPLGNVDTGKDDAQGHPLSFPLLDAIGLGRALRVTGVGGAIRAKYSGLSNADAISAAHRDIVNAWTGPAAGPPVRFGFTAAAGQAPAIGVPRTARVVAPGEVQLAENVKQALRDANPVVASYLDYREGKPLREVVGRQLRRFTPTPGRTEQVAARYPQIVEAAQVNNFLDDVIHQAKTMDRAKRLEYLLDAVKRVPPADRPRAWREFKRRRVMWQ